MRKPKPAVKALFAAMEVAREAEELMLSAPLKLRLEPPPEKAILIDPAWLALLGAKARA